MPLPSWPPSLCPQHQPVPPTVYRAGVRSTGSDRGDARQMPYLDRSRPLDRRPVAELTPSVLAPTPDRAIGLRGAHVGGACRDRSDIRQAVDLRGQGSVRRGAVAELAMRVVAPAPDRAVGLQSAGEGVPGGDSRGAGDAEQPAQGGFAAHPSCRALAVRIDSGPNTQTVLFDRTAHVWAYPATRAVTPPLRPATCAGVPVSVRVPEPSCPYSFQPQHQTVLSDFSAHECA